MGFPRLAIHHRQRAKLETGRGIQHGRLLLKALACRGASSAASLCIAPQGGGAQRGQTCSLRLLAGGQLNLHCICLLDKGKSSLLALPGLSGAGEDANLEDKPKEKRGTYRETISPGIPAPVQNSCTNASQLLAACNRRLFPACYGLQQAICIKGHCQYQHLVPLATFIPLV